MIERGFYFLGYDSFRRPLLLAQERSKTRETAKRLNQFCEQRKEAPQGAARLDDYVTHWQRRCRTGLGELLSELTCQAVPAPGSYQGKEACS